MVLLPVKNRMFCWGNWIYFEWCASELLLLSIMETHIYVLILKNCNKHDATVGFDGEGVLFQIINPHRLPFKSHCNDLEHQLHFASWMSSSSSVAWSQGCNGRNPTNYGESRGSHLYSLFICSLHISQVIQICFKHQQYFHQPPPPAMLISSFSFCQTFAFAEKNIRCFTNFEQTVAPRRKMARGAREFPVGCTPHPSQIHTISY